MSGLSLSLGLGLTSLRPSGGTPTPTPAPVITFDGTTFANTLGNPGQWQADGSDIVGQSGATVAYVEATMAGRAIQQSIAGVLSNVIVVEASALPATLIDFNVADTKLSAYPTTPFTMHGGGGATQQDKYTVASNQLSIAPLTLTGSPATAAIATQDTGSITHFAEMEVTSASYNQCAGLIFKAGSEISYLHCSFNGTDQLYIVLFDNSATGVNQGSNGIKLAGLSAVGSKIRLEASSDDKWRVLLKRPGDADFLPYGFAASFGAQSPQIDVWYSFSVGLHANTRVGFRGDRFGQTQKADNFRYGSLERPINLTSTTAGEEVVGGVLKSFILMAGTCAANHLNNAEILLIDNATGETLANWTAAPGAPGAGTSFSVKAYLPTSESARSVKAVLRDTALKGEAAVTVVSVPAVTQPVPMQLSLNIGGNGYFIDPMKDGTLIALRNGGWRDVLPGLYQTSTLDNQATYIPLAHLAPDANGAPTQWLQASDGYLATDNWGFKWDSFDHWPDYLQGTYDVTFPPGLEWSFSAAGKMTRTAYNSGAGTATIVISDVTTGSADNFFVTGYNGGKTTFPPSFFFNMVKQGSTETGAIHSAAITKLQRLVSHGTGGADGTYKGALRFMDMLATNRKAIAEFAMTGFVKNKINGSHLRAEAGPRISPAEILEMCTRVGCNLWLNVSDRMSNSEKLALAQYLFANKPAGMTIYLENSNEMWNFGPAFVQTSDIYSRSVAMGVSHTKLYVREFLNGVDTTAAPTWIGAEQGTLAVFQGVFGAADPKLVPVLAWQAATTSPTVITDMLNEQSIHAQTIKPVFAIGPYVGGGIGGVDLGDYNNQTVFTKAQRDTALGAGPTYTAYLGHFFAAQAVSSGQVRTFWRTFWKNLGDCAQAFGYERTAFMPATYEHQWQHTVESNTPTGTKADTLAAMTLALRDTRAGLAQNAQHDWLMETGGLFCLFQHQGKPTTSALDSYGMWGVCDQMQYDTQEPAASIAAWKIAKGV